MSVRIIYFHISEIPSQYANAVTVLKTCDALASLGADVKLYAADGGGSVGDIYSAYGLKNRFPIVRWHLSRKRGVGSTQFRVKALLVALANKNSIVYTREIGFAMLAAFFGHRRVCYELHALPYKRFQLFSMTFLARYLSFFRFFSISRAVEQAMLEATKAKKDDRFAVVPCAADIPMNIQPMNTSRTRISVGYVGHLYPGKGGEVITELARRLPNFEFHVVGRALTFEKELSSFENVQLHGLLSHSDAMAVLDTFSIVIAPYQENSSDQSGTVLSQWFSPLKIFEYMAHRKAIISSDLPVLREILEPGVDCLLVTPNDLDEWESAVTNLSSDDELRSRIANNARAKAIKHFSYSARGGSILNFVRSDTETKTNGTK